MSSENGSRIQAVQKYKSNTHGRRAIITILSEAVNDQSEWPSLVQRADQGFGLSFQKTERAFPVAGIRVSWDGHSAYDAGQLHDEAWQT
jgi:hypothetical protein